VRSNRQGAVDRNDDRDEGAGMGSWGNDMASGHARLRRLATAIVFGTVTVLGAAAHGQSASGNKAAAEALFNDAVKLMNGSDLASACPKLEESQKLDPAVGTLLYLGECYELQGRTATAWATFNSAAGAARAAGQAGREKTAQDRAAALEPKLSKVTIVVPAEAAIPGLEVTRDGVSVGGGSLGSPTPMDPGDHKVAARAPGRKSWSQTVKLGGAGATVVVNVPVLTEDPTAAAAPPPAGSASLAGGEPKGRGQSGPPLPSDQAGASSGSGARTAQLIAGGVVAGVGVVGIVIGAVFGAEARSKESDSEAYCRPEDPTLCSQQGLDLLDEGHSSATIANVGFIAGGVLAAGGVVLLLTAPSGEDPPAPAGEDENAPTPSPHASAARHAGHSARAELAPVIGPTAVGLALRGAW
jgi:hypothetical protein